MGTHPALVPRHAAAITVLGSLAVVLGCRTPAPPAFDLVIVNGRVMDPETRLDRVTDVGISGGVVQAISRGSLAGRDTIDAANLVVAPGFIDLHAHGQTLENYRLQAMDGVTTALELELGTSDVDAWYAEREGVPPINYGVAVGHARVRVAVMGDSGATFPSGPGAHRAGSESEVQAILAGIEKGLARGALGVGLGLQYTPAASRREVLEAFRLAVRHGAPAFVHLRYLGTTPPGAVAGLEEVIAAVTTTGASLHVFHVHSSGLRAAPELLRMIADARRRGLDVTTEAYPYSAGSTAIESALFDPGWQKVFGIDYGDLEWPPTGERLTAKSFARYRRQGGWIVIHVIPEPIVDSAIASPLTIIASDGRLERGRGHPRAAGTYARVLGRYVRERKLLTLMDALAKMSLMPARRLEGRVPAMKRKGRVQVGADADLVIFDPAAVIDRATYREPALPSAGIAHLLVGGVRVVRDGRLVEGTAAGRAIRAAWTTAQVPVVIHNVTVIPMTGPDRLTEQTVVVRDGRIVGLGSAAQVRVPAGATVVDGTGKYLIPGLFEMHAHSSKARASAFGLYVVHGVTTIRDQGSEHAEVLRWRREIRAGSRVGPRMLIAGPYLESLRNIERMRRDPPESRVEPFERARIPIGSPADARRVIDSLAGLELDHFKIRTVQDRETYLALAKAAHAHGKRLVGHVVTASPATLLEARQDGIDHVFPPSMDSMPKTERMAFWRELAARDVGVVPTLVTATESGFRALDYYRALVTDTAAAVHPLRPYVSRFMLLDWREQVEELTPERREYFDRGWPIWLQQVREMRQAGVRLMTGSDVAVLNVFPGYSLHEELRLFVDSVGMSPLEALAAATRKPAEWLGLADSVGTVAPGKIADLVLLDGDPLASIGNTRRISAVLLRGRLFQRRDLDGLLAAVAAMPDQRVNDWVR